MGGPLDGLPETREANTRLLKGFFFLLNLYSFEIHNYDSNEIIFWGN